MNAYLSQIQNGGSCPISPLMATFWTSIPCLPKAMHDRLQNGSKGGYSYSSPDENSMLSVENLTCWGTKRSVDIYLQLSIKHIHKNRWLICRISYYFFKTYSISLMIRRNDQFQQQYEIFRSKHHMYFVRDIQTS